MEVFRGGMADRYPIRMENDIGSSPHRLVWEDISSLIEMGKSSYVLYIFNLVKVNLEQRLSVKPAINRKVILALASWYTWQLPF